MSEKLTSELYVNNEEEEFEETNDNLTFHEFKENMEDPAYLPTNNAIINMFKEVRLEHKAGELAGFVERHQMHEILTKEYINQFAGYLAEKIENYGGSKENPAKLLEVGAGDGRLSYFLNRKLNKLVPGKFNLVATDSGEEVRIKPVFDVEKIDYKAALKKYSPTIVISSWMPAGVDWTSDFRSEPSVKEYILVGPPFDATCGDMSLTWGEEEFYNDETGKIEYKEEQPPYEKDGFELDFLGGNYQRSWIESMGAHSSTVIFIRKK